MKKILAVVAAIGAAVSVTQFVVALIIFLVAAVGALWLIDPSAFEEFRKGKETSSEHSNVDYGNFLDQYATKISQLDMAKVREKNPSKDLLPGMYNSGRPIVEDLEGYLLMAEVLQRPEINPTYSKNTEEQEALGAKWTITPQFMYGMWYHETLIGGHPTAEGELSSLWEMSANSSNMLGAFQQAKGANTSSGAERIVMYISRFESPELDDKLRAIRGTPAELLAGQAIAVGGEPVAYSQISQHIKFQREGQSRPSSHFLPDALYTQALCIRQMMGGHGRWAWTNVDSFRRSAENLTEWQEHHNWSNEVASQLAFLSVAQAMSGWYTVSQNPDLLEVPMAWSYGDIGAHQRIYLQMVLSGVPLDFWAKRDPQWAPGLNFSTISNMYAETRRVGEYLTGGVVYDTSRPVTDWVGRDGVIQRLERSATTPLIFPQLDQSFTDGWQFLSQQQYGATLAYQSTFSIESLNIGQWVVDSIYHEIDLLYNNPEWRLPEELPDSEGPVEPGIVTPGTPAGQFVVTPHPSGGGTIDGNLAAVKNACPRVTSPNGVRTTSGKQHVSPGILRSPVPTNKQSRGYFYGHPGVDFTPGAGTPVTAVLDGIVLRSVKCTVEKNSSYGFGTHVVVMHCVNGFYFFSSYAHFQASSYGMVNVGQLVTQGQQLGRVGQTGYSTGNHLHFQLGYRLSSGSNWSWGYPDAVGSLTYTWNPVWSGVG